MDANLEVERRCFDIACYTQWNWPPLPLTFLWPKSLGSLSKQFTLPDITYMDLTEPADPSTRSTYNWNGEHYVRI